MNPATISRHGEVRLTPQLQEGLTQALQAAQTQGGAVRFVHQRGDAVVRGADGDHAAPENGFISLAAGESLHDGTQRVVDAKRGMKIAAALVLTGLGAGTLGYLANEIWYRNRIVAPLGGMYGAYGLYGGYGGYGMGGW